MLAGPLDERVRETTGAAADFQNIEFPFAFERWRLFKDGVAKPRSIVESREQLTGKAKPVIYGWLDYVEFPTRIVDAFEMKIAD